MGGPQEDSVAPSDEIAARLGIVRGNGKPGDGTRLYRVIKPALGLRVPIFRGWHSDSPRGGYSPRNAAHKHPRSAPSRHAPRRRPGARPPHKPRCYISAQLSRSHVGTPSAAPGGNEGACWGRQLAWRPRRRSRRGALGVGGNITPPLTARRGGASPRVSINTALSSCGSCLCRARCQWAR